jgi:hypothetical protein
MKRPSMLQVRIVSIIKKVVLLAALAAIAGGGWMYYASTRPDLPEIGADYVAGAYLQAIQGQDYQTAYLLACTAAQQQTTPGQVGDLCKEIYAGIDTWQFGAPKYLFTHTSASVPVRLSYRAPWSPGEQSVMNGKLDFKLENGEWRLVVAVPFATAIMKQREDQHFGGK